MAIARSEYRRIDQEQNKNYKRSLTWIFFTIITLVFSMATFMNPSFMKKQAQTSNGQVIVQKQINEKFDRLATLVGGKSVGNSNLLTQKQTQPIVNVMYDYSLGLHWFKNSDLGIAKNILNIINTAIDDDSASNAQDIRQQLNKQSNNAEYIVIDAFDLTDLTLQANIVTLFFFINIVIIVVCLLSLYSIIEQMKKRSDKRLLIHDIFAAGMRTGIIMMIFYGALAMIPVIVNVEALPLKAFAYWLELASGIFLEAVIVGVVVFVISAVPWQISAPE